MLSRTNNFNLFNRRAVFEAALFFAISYIYHNNNSKTTKDLQ